MAHCRYRLKSEKVAIIVFRGTTRVVEFRHFPTILQARDWFDANCERLGLTLDDVTFECGETELSVVAR